MGGCRLKFRRSRRAQTFVTEDPATVEAFDALRPLVEKRTFDEASSSPCDADVLADELSRNRELGVAAVHLHQVRSDQRPFSRHADAIIRERSLKADAWRATPCMAYQKRE